MGSTVYKACIICGKVYRIYYKDEVTGIPKCKMCRRTASRFKFCKRCGEKMEVKPYIAKTGYRTYSKICNKCVKTNPRNTRTLGEYKCNTIYKYREQAKAILEDKLEWKKKTYQL